MSDFLDRLKAALADRYAIEREIGAGGMATVYLAQDLKHDRKVAVKVLRPELAAAIGGERFLVEIKTTANLQHPHILPLFDSGEADGFLYYVMPYVEGESLRDRINREKQLPVEDALKIATEVAGALHSAHRHDVVHRDIKPENILLEEGHAVVADFGIARGISAAGGEKLTGTGLAVGTPAYMSPEQAAGTRDLDGRSDIYSLACVLYEMLAGQPPFLGATVESVVRQHFTADPPRVTAIRSVVPGELEAVICRALAKTPADRYATAAQLAAALTDSTMTMSRHASGVQASPTEKSIAVLPFTNMSVDTENEYFSDGITEEIITALANLKELRVVARTSAFSFKGKDEDVRVVGEKLNVSKILEGSVRKAGNRVRITAQLVNVTDGFHLWTETYDRELTDVFEIQDDIARAIVSALIPKLADREQEPLVKRHTENREAYHLYLKGRYCWNKRTEEGLRQSVEYLKQAVAEDPNFALALAGLADSYATLGIYGALPPNEVMLLAKAAAERALDLDGVRAEAFASLGCVRSLYDWDWVAAESDFKRAIEINPQYPAAHHWYAMNHLTPLGRFDEARTELRRARELDPLSSIVNSSVGLLYYFERHYDPAIEEYRNVLEIDANFGIAYYFLGQAYEQKSMYEEAIAAFQKAISLTSNSPETVAALGHAYARAGNRDEAQELLQKLMARSDHRYVSPALIAQIYVGLGEQDLAFEWLQRAYDQRSTELAWLRVRPVFDSLRSESRFAELLTRIGLV